MKPPFKLVLQNLAYETEQQQLFNNLNNSLSEGDLLQVFGTNGSGKSTLLRIIAGYIEPHHGQVLWENNCIFNKTSSYQQQLHYIGHQNALKPYLTVLENVKLQLSLKNKKIDLLSIQLILKKLSLSHLENTLTYKLSAGQLRRLALAKLSLNPTPLWLLDEPLTSLDHQGTLFLTELLTTHVKQGGIAIVATHQPLSLITKSLFLGEQHAELSY